MIVIVGADFGSEGEARRDRQAESGHFGEIGTLPAEQVTHLLVAFGFPGAK